jgi:hypothetical protein
MTLFGALLCGVAAWCIVGFTAAQILTRTGTGGNDGGSAMAGFFAIGGFGGLLGAGISAWIIWSVLADPARTGMVGGSLAGLLVVLVIGIAFAMSPPPQPERNDFPAGMRGELQVEAKLPSQFKPDAIRFELRAAGFFQEVPALAKQSHPDAGSMIVPGAFPVKIVRQWILGVMNGDKQLAVTDAGIDRFNDTLKESTEWTSWTPIESGVEVRWRFAVLPK